MSPVTDIPPVNSKDWILIKEWNEAITPLSYADSEDFTYIPNIEANYDSLNFNRDFGFTDDEIGLRFAGRFFRYSVTPYSLVGRVGEEVFSNEIIIANKIMSINPITVYIEYSGDDEYDIEDDYDSVPVLMLDHTTINVDVDWNDSTIDYVDPGEDDDEYTVEGTVVGYQDADDVDVEFKLVVSNDLPDPVISDIQISGNTRIQVPTSSSTITNYSATVYDQNGNPLIGETVTWGIQDAGSGITINSSTGALTVTSSAAGADEFTITASAGSETDSLTVRTAKAYASLSTSSTSTDTRNTYYEITVKDDQGIGISGLTMNDIFVNRVYTGSSTYQSLTSLHNSSSRVSVRNFIYEGDGIYTWTVYSRRFDSTRNDGGVQVRYNSTPIQIGGTSLRVRYDN